jgi:3-hydroxyacyl-CoA dehydrogenase
MNIIGEGVGAMLERALERLAGGDWKGLVIGGRGENLTAGANLKLILGLIAGSKWDALGALITRFQRVNQALRGNTRPVVVACRGLALGGGCELALHAARVVAAAESYVGLVEVGAGVIPAGGGCKELVRRLDESLPAEFEGDLLPFVQRLFMTIGKAQVSGSAEQARALGFLGARDAIVMNADHLWHAARQAVLDLDRDGWVPPWPRRDLRVMGEAGLAALEVGLWNLEEGRAISAHDRLVGRKLATVLCGGAVGYGVRVSEQHLLDLEREAFLSLCGERKTQERMESLLSTGKPLRN